ncbi:hypothetical protein JCM11641_001593, partial [Rhodosporidiobolus odoratus]
SFNTLRTNVFADPEGKLDTASIYALIANDAATNTVDTITSGVAAMAAVPASQDARSRTTSSTSRSSDRPRENRENKEPREPCGHCGHPGHATAKCRKKAIDNIETAIKAGFLQRDASGNISRRAVVPAAAAAVTPTSPLSSTPLDSPADPLDIGFAAGFAATITTTVSPSDVPALSVSADPIFYLDSGAGAHMVGDASL